MVYPEQIVLILKKYRFNLSDEKLLQAELEEILLRNYGERMFREKRLDKKNIIDFLIDGIGIEVKIGGSKKAIYQQCVRYCSFEEVKSLILVTNVAIGFPKEINKKDCFVLKLGQAWL